MVIIDEILISYKNEIIMINTFTYLAAFLSLHYDKYDPNQFKMSLKFFLLNLEIKMGAQRKEREKSKKKVRRTD